MKEDKKILVDGMLTDVAHVRHYSYDTNHGDSSRIELDSRRMSVIRKVLDAWRRLDASVFSQVLHDDFRYDSHWVKETLDRSGCLKYIAEKFQTIARANSGPQEECVELTEGLLPIVYPYAIYMTQGTVQTLLLFTFVGDKISTLSITDPDLYTYHTIEK